MKMKLILALLVIMGVLSTSISSYACSSCGYTKELVNFNKNDDKDDDDSDGNAGEPKKRDHKGRKHRGAE
jgi:hypothetical protein